MMSQVLVCGRQAVCSWDGFHFRPTFLQVVEAIENIFSEKKQKKSGVIKLLKLYLHTLSALQLQKTTKHIKIVIVNHMRYP